MKIKANRKRNLYKIPGAFITLLLIVSMFITVMPVVASAEPRITVISAHTTRVSNTPTINPENFFTVSNVDNSACLSCHGTDTFHLELQNGDSFSLYVDGAKLTASIHSALKCTDCHSAISGFPHPDVKATTRRDYTLALYEACKQCHFDNYTKTLDSVHYQVLETGDQNAPVCVDCHGYHDVQNPAQPRSKISQTCKPCHQNEYNQYSTSVHGAALIQDNNTDVPVCTDCHVTHSFKNPSTPAFRFESVTICSNCHGNATLMKKYGISTSVVKSYLQDFHGTTVSLASKENKDIWVAEAVCTDCHGVHDITIASSLDSPVIKENLLHVCQKCHPDATTNFPAAWLSHYEPSLKNATLVFLVNNFYWALIPFIVIGLLSHIFIELRRKAKKL